MDKEKPNYYGILPADVRYCTCICSNAKVLYTEFTALSNKKGYCWPTNEYFANLYKKSTASISTWIKQLKEQKFIYIYYEYRGAEVTKRYIFINEKSYKLFLADKENLNRKGVDKENLNRTDKENLKDNNTSINNTSINNTSINKTIREEENLIIQEAEKSPEFTKAFSEFLLDDSNDYRKEKLYWIVHNAKKHNSTLKDIIEALQVCYDKDKVGDMSYFTGVLRMKDKNRSEGVRPIGKPVQWIADEYLRDRFKIHNDYIKQYDVDILNNKLYYSIYKNDDKEIYNSDRKAVFDFMNLITADLKKETGVFLKAEFRI